MKSFKDCVQLLFSNTITGIKVRLLCTFAVVAFTSSFLVYLLFWLHLSVGEDDQFSDYLGVFQNVAQQYYSGAQNQFLPLGANVSAYYSIERLQEDIPGRFNVPVGETDRVVSDDHRHFTVSHSLFKNNEGQPIPLFLIVETQADSFIDISRNILMGISFVLMLFLIMVLRYVLQRTFNHLMAPVSELTQQLSIPNDHQFSVSDDSVKELRLLTDELNRYKHMKERLAKQEMMFAKYASHELKTPIAIILGAANLMGMKDDAIFQAR